MEFFVQRADVGEMGYAKIDAGYGAGGNHVGEFSGFDYGGVDGDSALGIIEEHEALDLQR